MILCRLFSDAFLFPLLQAGIVLFALFAALRDWIQRRKAGRDNLGKQPKRGDVAVGYFLVVCAARSSAFRVIPLPKC